MSIGIAATLFCEREALLTTALASGRSSGVEVAARRNQFRAMSFVQVGLTPAPNADSITQNAALSRGVLRSIQRALLTEAQAL